VLRRSDGQRGLELYQSLPISLLSTLLSTVLVNPLDLVFTRYQVIDSSKEKLSAIKIIKDLIKHEGIEGTFKGLKARMLFSGMHSMIWFPIYERYKALYGSDS